MNILTVYCKHQIGTYENKQKVITFQFAKPTAVNEMLIMNEVKLFYLNILADAA